jgi:hypothetical protein
MRTALKGATLTAFSNRLRVLKYFVVCDITCASAMEPSKKLRGVAASPVYESSLAVDASMRAWRLRNLDPALRPPSNR